MEVRICEEHGLPMEWKELEHQSGGGDPVSDWMCPVCEQEEAQAWAEILGPVYDKHFAKKTE